MGAFNQLNGAIFDAAAIEARISAVDGKSIYNQRDGGILDFDSLARRLSALDGKVAVGQGGIEFDVDTFMRRLVAIETGGATSAFNPSSLFGASDRGAVFDFTSASQLAQSSAGTTPVATAADPIGYAKDIGPLGKNATQVTAANKPLWLGTPQTLGVEKVADPYFAGPTGWSGGTGWSIAPGAATKTAGVASDLTTTISVANNEVCFVFYWITRTAGTITPSITGGTTVSGAAQSATGSYVEMLVGITGNTTLTLSADAAFAGTVKAASVKTVTAYSTQGAWFDGVNDLLSTASVDLTNTSRATLVVSWLYGQRTANMVPVGVGNVAGSTPGSLDAFYSSTPGGRLFGSTATATSLLGTSEGAPTGVPKLQVTTLQADLTQATIAQQIIVRSAGVTPSQTPGGALAGSTVFANAAISVGSEINALYPAFGCLYRALVIGRTLTAAETTQAEGWARRGMGYCAVLGDSTSAPNSAGGGLTNNYSTSAFVGGMICGVADVATIGDKIADQKTKWTAIPDKTALQAVIIQVGLNDINTYIGVSKTTAQIIADLQDLVNTVAASMPAGCVILISQLTPAKGWLGVAGGHAAAAYQAWLDVNIAIAGAGPTPIASVAGRITAHVALLNDGAGNLKTIYDQNSDGVHPTNEGKFIIATQAWRPALVTAGILT